MLLEKFRVSTPVNTGGKIPRPPPPKKRDDRPEKPPTVIVVGITRENFLGRPLTLKEKMTFNKASRPDGLVQKINELPGFLRSLGLSIEGDNLQTGALTRGRYITLGCAYYEVDKSNLTGPCMTAIMKAGYTIHETRADLWLMQRNDPDESLIKGPDRKNGPQIQGPFTK